MSSDHPAAPPPEPAPDPLALLERITAVALVAVVVALGWMAVTAYAPDWLRLSSLELEVLLVLGILGVALALVSLVALLHTRQ